MTMPSRGTSGQHLGRQSEPGAGWADGVYAGIGFEQCQKACPGMLADQFQMIARLYDVIFRAPMRRLSAGGRDRVLDQTGAAQEGWRRPATVRRYSVEHGCFLSAGAGDGFPFKNEQRLSAPDPAGITSPAFHDDCREGGVSERDV